ncbi:hypothetical protein QNH46_22270 [Paenibacillus woosongensis]|uniref:DUF4352 domain-containing protein n=1 Tax=Paenibacillus woosongensis TaxID=307580 RepID=A0AA95L1Z2_9BACL|nr:hypothetical protein [Paenibacillus woosongensis]WHX48747.1 hypothetical protein QNH46_22270 [Paenibacillus woosongensis]
MNRTKMVVASLAVAALMTQSAAGAADAAVNTQNNKAAAAQAVKTLGNLSGVKISGKSTVKLSNVNILSQGDGNILTYTLTYQNNDSKTLSLIDYWTKVKTKSGTVYSVSVVGADKEKKKVVPGSSVNVTYTTKIAKHLKYSDLNFQIVKWDFSVAGYEQVLGSINIPSTYAVATPVNTTRKLTLNEFSANAKVMSVNVLGSGDSNYVNIALYLQNTGSSTIDNPSLKYVVQTPSGTAFAVTPDAASTNIKIYPQENKTLNLIAKIPKNVNLNNLQLLLVQNDESTKSDIPVASMGLGTKQGQSSKTAANKERLLKIDSTNIATKVVSIARNQSFGKSDLSIQFSIANKGDKTVTIPNYSFDVQVGGKTYPLVASGLEGMIIEPNEEQIISVDGTIPVIANEDEIDLVMKTPTGSSQGAGEESSPSQVNSYPVAIYNLPDYTEMQYAQGQERTIKNNDGVFGVTLDAIQKLPWNDGNLLATKITIVNKGTKAAKLPEFAGAYKMDLTALSSTVHLVNTNNTQILGAGEKTSVYVVANVPSSLKFSQLQVQLLQKTGADKTSNWIMFSNYGNTSGLKQIAEGSYFNLDTAGRKSDLKTRKTYLYKGSTSDIIYTEIIMRNLENKQTNLSQLAGYFLTDDGQYYKADVNQVKHAVGPESSSLVTFSAKVPKGTTVSNWNLVVGESISEDKFTEAEGKPTGYVNASSMELNLDSRSIQDTLKDVELFPYTLTIKEIEGRTNSAGLEVKMKYDLKRDLTYDMGEFQHKFILEVTDSSGARFEKEIELEKDFLVGNNQNFSFVINDQIFATTRSGAFQFSIFDSYQGEKTKIATKAAYFVNEDLF